MHSKSINLDLITRQADIVIAAVGKPLFVKGNMVKQGAIVIDVGIHRLPSQDAKTGYHLVGDVDFEDVKNKVLAISPVPGGVGPLTIAMLMKNTVKAFELQEKIST
jgi:methylenetetrahydrofolate dehydrogenase (NADP+)/methenyltetrahydrofolate cyclohydrolase